MAYTTPATAAFNGTLTASMWNTSIRDNISYLYDAQTVSTTNYNSYVAGQSFGTITSDYSVGTADNYKMYKVDPAGGTISITLGTANTTGSKIDFVQTGSGTVNFSGTSGGSVNSTPSSQLRTQYSAASIIKLDNTTWLLTGDLA